MDRVTKAKIESLLYALRALPPGADPPDVNDLAAKYQLDPLTEAETRQYIQHRLLIAGSEKEIFTADAAREIYLFSLGYPIMINIICDRALLTGYADSRTTLDRNVIRECAQELSIHSLE